MTKYRERREAGEYAPPAQAASLDAMTKAQLLDHARANNIQANNDMTKDQIRAAIDAAAG